MRMWPLPHQMLQNGTESVPSASRLSTRTDCTPCGWAIRYPSMSYGVFLSRRDVSLSSVSWLLSLISWLLSHNLICRVHGSACLRQYRGVGSLYSCLYFHSLFRETLRYMPGMRCNTYYTWHWNYATILSWMYSSESSTRITGWQYSQLTARKWLFSEYTSYCYHKVKVMWFKFLKLITCQLVYSSTS